MMKRIFLLLFLAVSTWPVHSQKPSGPQKDFEKFYSTFKDNYAFFKVKHINWDSLYLVYKPQVKPQTTEDELIGIFKQMVEPLHDGHVTILKGDEFIYSYRNPSYFKKEFKGMEKEFWNTSFATLRNLHFDSVTGVGPMEKKENLYYVSRGNNTGYIKITRCFGTRESIFDDKKEKADTKLMLSLMDSLLTTMANTKALIIDVRCNGGGHAGFELASRFLNEKTLTHYEAIKRKGDEKTFPDPQPEYLEPNQGVRYVKPIIILANDRTASAAEDFMISLWHQSHVTIIGTATAGQFSDMYEGKLSHNISFTLSNEMYFSASKDVLEGKGITPDIEIKNSKQDLETGIDPVITKAVEIAALKE